MKYQTHQHEQAIQANIILIQQHGKLTKTCTDLTCKTSHTMLTSQYHRRGSSIKTAVAITVAAYWEMFKPMSFSVSSSVRFKSSSSLASSYSTLQQNTTYINRRATNVDKIDCTCAPRRYFGNLSIPAFDNCCWTT